MRGKPDIVAVTRYLRNGGQQIEGELLRRVTELLREAPVVSRGLKLRVSGVAAEPFGVADGWLLCGTIGVAFDAWHRRLAVTSAADALIAQAIGTAAVEQVMDELEQEARACLAAGERLLPRWSPGYSGRPLALSAQLLAHLDAGRRLGVSLTASQLLVPSKSVTAVAEVEQVE